MFVRRITYSLLILVALVVNAPGQEPVEVDWLLKSGRIIDGTGAAEYVGDVAIQGGKIVAVTKSGKFEAKRVVDCSGLVIAPGFIDLHNHSDEAMYESSTRSNVTYLSQGCTSVVTGNCGSGPIDVESFLRKVNEAHPGTNVLHLLPHGSIRSQVVGRGSEDPSETQIKEMCDLAEKAMRAGAWGMSTGLIYVPGTYSKTEEIVAVAKVVAKYEGIYASHIRNEGSGLLDAIQEALRIGREAKLPVHISHFKSSGRENWGGLKAAADLISQARQTGMRVTADQYPYIASSTSLDATLLPTWSRDGGRKSLESRLASTDERARIRKEVKSQLDSKSRIQIAAYAPRRDWVGKSIDEIAAMEKLEPVDVVLKIEETGGAKIVNFGMSEEDVRFGMTLDWVATASDGGSKIPSGDQPHPRSFGTFTRKIGYYAIRESTLPLVQAIRSCSGLPAEIIGLTDRGTLKAGLAADVCVLDPKSVIDRATYDEPFRTSSGVNYVFVNGVPAIFEGSPTGALAGRALAKPNSQVNQ